MPTDVYQIPDESLVPDTAAPSDVPQDSHKSPTRERGTGPVTLPTITSAFDSAWTIVLICTLTIALRAMGITHWSMWEDEEGSIYHTQQSLDFGITKFFPPFFVLLKGVYAVTGVSVVAGRAVSAAFGVASVVLVYTICRKWLSQPTALLAMLLVSLNIGHLFWSQSVRYYTMVEALQLLCLFWTLHGLESGRVSAMVLS